MVDKTKYALLLLLLALFLSVAAALEKKDESITVKASVWVDNKLPSGQNFTIHCQSKDDDLGVHTILPNQNYTFHFHNNIWGTTLFFCRVTTSYGQGLYDFYKYKRDKKRCTDCAYMVTKDGVYALSTVRGQYDFIFKWE
ncbi:hypothetical protein SAY86_009684 [Trapa natans]|uniref:S-protein homolog n=1 Tax=Trapa natans TaxID=22666 RepID=A0AAN7L053_TRANT|nr:hypothetical protein SAY86_009684 [Trapa natans]